MSASESPVVDLAGREPRRDRLPRPTDRLRLGGSGLRVSPICLGLTWSPEVVPAAYEAGINFFFVTADLHWPLYEHTRTGLARLLRRPGIRDRIVVGVVSYLGEHLFKHLQFGEVLDAIPGLDRIDLLIAGAAMERDFAERHQALCGARAAGRFGARAIGTSFHDRAAARAALQGEMVDVAYIRYNPGHRGAEREVLPFVSRSGRSRPLLFNFKNTMFSDASAAGPSGWRPHVTDYYRYVLTRPEIDGVLTAFATPEEIDGLAGALEEGPLADWQLRHLEELARLQILSLRARRAVASIE